MSSEVSGERSRMVDGNVEVLDGATSRGCSSKLTRADFFFLPPSKALRDGVSLVSLDGLAAPVMGGRVKLGIGEALPTEDAGLCFIADFAGETSLGGGACISGFKIGEAEKWADRCGLIEVFLPLDAASRAGRGTSRLAERS